MNGVAEKRFCTKHGIEMEVTNDSVEFDSKTGMPKYFFITYRCPRSHFLSEVPGAYRQMVSAGLKS